MNEKNVSTEELFTKAERAQLIKSYPADKRMKKVIGALDAAEGQVKMLTQAVHSNNTTLGVAGMMVDDVAKKYGELAQFFLEENFHLMSEPFIPESLGFVMSNDTEKEKAYVFDGGRLILMYYKMLGRWAIGHSILVDFYPTSLYDGKKMVEMLLEARVEMNLVSDKVILDDEAKAVKDYFVLNLDGTEIHCYLDLPVKEYAIRNFSARSFELISGDEIIVVALDEYKDYEIVGVSPGIDWNTPMIEGVGKKMLSVTLEVKNIVAQEVENV